MMNKKKKQGLILILLGLLSISFITPLACYIGLDIPDPGGYLHYVQKIGSCLLFIISLSAGVISIVIGVEKLIVNSYEN